VRVRDAVRAMGAPTSSSAHLTPVERAELGREARAETPRQGHAFVAQPTNRDPIALLEAQAVSRVPELVPIRYGRMLVSPFSFFRGGAAIMARDLAAAPTTRLEAQLCGDAHLANFGGFASPERQLVFDLNDFDETHPGPFEWDVKRMVASFEVAGRERGFSKAQRGAAALAAARSYREAMRQFAAMPNLDVWYARLDAQAVESELAERASQKAARALGRAVAKGRTRTSLRALSKLTREVDGVRRIISDPPLLVPIDELLQTDAQRTALEAGMSELTRAYASTVQRNRRTVLESFRYVDLARKVVGVGSVGTRCWIVLMQGRDDGDPLFLQVKEAEASVLEAVLGPSEYGNHAQRVVEGQRLLQASSDILLGWIRMPDLDGQARDMYVRQLWDRKTSANLEVLDPAGLALYARACGWTLARGHARSGDRIPIAAYLGKGDVFDRAVVAFAEAYADLNERDHAALREAVASGRVSAVEGV
jgi:uncharacterized protein (DUF2252 family)